MTTGQLIKEARKNAGMTQTELAKRLDIPFQSVSQWERDLRNPKIENLIRIADALNVDVADLYDFSIQSEKDRAFAQLEEVRRKLNTAAEQDREELEYALAVLEESYEDMVFASALQNMSMTTPEHEKTKREKMTDAFDMLNDDGQQKAVERVEELTEIPRYRRQEPAETPSQPPAGPQEGTDTAPPPTTPETPPEGE